MMSLMNNLSVGRKKKAAQRLLAGLLAVCSIPLDP